MVCLPLARLQPFTHPTMDEEKTETVVVFVERLAFNAASSQV
jgi:hypothetical protein